MTDTPPDFNPETAPPRLTIDWDAYLPFFENEEISDQDKQELIEALWAIVVSFVDLGFGVHPVQHVCGQDISLPAPPYSDVVDCEVTPTDQNDTMPLDSTPQAGEGSPDV
ncbi:hypothetical protein CEW89_15390 [Celeribacter ethanolicus]|uniref:Uncharacterized protein n=1 Tax=Celeribacter ethanolicus TaxID=1758178 RepID=A0A291GFJ8_9RHOB|nr:hypothetical protein [Celeribacter ethanolicus]ATG48830.1 hypothetical protein CEW89_15390 [Celeribacter ethanolicus]